MVERVKKGYVLGVGGRTRDSICWPGDIPAVVSFTSDVMSTQSSSEGRADALTDSAPAAGADMLLLRQCVG